MGWTWRPPSKSLRDKGHVNGCFVEAAVAKRGFSWVNQRALNRSFNAMSRMAVRMGANAVKTALKPSSKKKSKLVFKPRAKPLRPTRVQAMLAGDMVLGLAGSRRYRLYRPPDHQTGIAKPMLVMLHGCAQDATALASVSQMNRVAARLGFFVLYPEQDRLSNLQGCWNWFASRSGQAQREADSIMAVIDQVCKTQRVDGQKLALAGLSAGASLAALVATRQPARFCAVAMHSGVPPSAAQSQATALRAMRGRGPTLRPMPPLIKEMRLPALLVIHGSADSVVAPRNGLDAALQWATCAGAKAGSARSVQRGKRYATSVTDYKAAGRLVVTHCLVNGLGHAWSGGAARRAYSDAHGPDASRMIGAFALKQFHINQNT